MTSEQQRHRPETIHHTAVQAFVKELAGQLAGDCDFSSAAVALYTSDASNYRQIPLGVVYPGSIDDIVLVNAACRAHRLPVLMRGGGTSQNGQCVNEAVILDCSRYLYHVLHIDTANRTALIEPGVVCDSLKDQAEMLDLTFGPDPGTHSRCTLGGMIGNNSCGPRSMLAGKTVENLVELEVLTSDGARFWTGPTSDVELQRIIAGDDRQAEIYAELLSIRDTHADQIRDRYPTIKRRVSGYNLDQLLPENGFNVARALVGSEGTCVSILQARVRLIEKPKHTRLIVLGFDDIFLAGDVVRHILPHAPSAMEGLDWGIVGGLIDRSLKTDGIALLPAGRAWLMVELVADSQENLRARSARFDIDMQQLDEVRSIKQVQDPQAVQAIWSIRELGASATSMSLNPADPDPIVGWEDTAVDPLQLGDYLREFQALVTRYGYSTCLYGHFGDGCIHARITFDTRSSDGIVQWRRFSEEIAHLVVHFGGSLSGEHGDGQAKAEFLPILFGDDLMDAFRRFKRAWDPDARMNPGKLIDAYRMDENLRFGPDYATPIVATTLHFREAGSGFGRVTEHCIGMGKCRSLTGSMCPSYQATREERYSTRGRAHLLHELVRGEVPGVDWASTALADSMEHCLSCKICKSECPTQVDIASYKAEFMNRHHATRRRPLHQHVFGRAGSWLPYAARFTRLVNWAQAGITGRLAQRLLGISAEKPLPPLASKRFILWAREHARFDDPHFYWMGDRTGTPVVLWNDTVNSHYRPAVLISAVRVLIACGFSVAISRRHFCCGRPLYEYGFLREARQQSQAILEGFHARLPADAPVVVLEPSCLSVFKDELARLFPDDDQATDLGRRCLSLCDLLTERGIQAHRTLGHGVLHLHCHDKALTLSRHERHWMRACFDTLQEVEVGCCGMAGTYGMRERTRPIATALFNRNLKPAIDQIDDTGVVVANGFSCHEQILDHTGRKPLHPVQVIDLCLQGTEPARIDSPGHHSSRQQHSLD